jgi:hypothetical protein
VDFEAGSGGVTGRSFDPLRADRPLIGPADDRDGEAAGADRGDDQAAARVGGIRLDVARRTECYQAVEVEVGASLGALDDVVDLEAGGHLTHPRLCRLGWPVPTLE